MGYQLERLGAGIDEERLTSEIERITQWERRRFKRLWMYYRNPMQAIAVSAGESGSERPYRQAQEWGLPSRITGIRSGIDVWNISDAPGIIRKEVVIENDIAWRIDTGVAYLFGRSLNLTSSAPDPKRRETITRLLRLIIAKNGGVLFLQQLALIGSVHGFVDVLVKWTGLAGGTGPGLAAGSDEAVPETADASLPPQSSSSAPEILQQLGETGNADDESTDGTDAVDDVDFPGIDDEALAKLADQIRLEIVEPANAVPFLSASDYRVIDAYAHVREKSAVHSEQAAAKKQSGWLGRWFAKSSRSTTSSKCPQIIDVITAHRWQRYEDGALIAEGVNSLGVVPVVHIQNLAMPFEYSGASDVEPLIPLQDELNIRLSDRASRISLQSFKMYLGVGIQNFVSLPVGPGRMWSTDNDKGKVQEFGGDANCPSEESHIRDIREAMDKVSTVTPIAAGAIKDKIGNLTSAAALCITMMALLSKTESKRTTYGSAIGRICELALLWLDKSGAFPTAGDERRIELHWSSPLPESDQDRLTEAESKLRIGVAKEVVLRELGY